MSLIPKDRRVNTYLFAKGLHKMGHNSPSHQAIYKKGLHKMGDTCNSPSHFVVALDISDDCLLS